MAGDHTISDESHEKIDRKLTQAKAVLAVLRGTCTDEINMKIAAWAAEEMIEEVHELVGHY